MCTTSKGKENKVAVNTTKKSFPNRALSCDAFSFNGKKPSQCQKHGVQYHRITTTRHVMHCFKNSCGKPFLNCAVFLSLLVHGGFSQVLFNSKTVRQGAFLCCDIFMMAKKTVKMVFSFPNEVLHYFSCALSATQLHPSAYPWSYEGKNYFHFACSYSFFTMCIRLDKMKVTLQLCCAYSRNSSMTLASANSYVSINH